MKKHYLLLSIILTISIILSGCSGSKANKKEDIQRERTYIERYEDAIVSFEAKKYYKCIEDFTFVVFNAPGSDIADDAQFYVASCHFEMKEYLLAINEYQQLLRRWPHSDLHEETQFKIAECYYEQSPGYQRDQGHILKAILAYQDFIEEYPLSNYREDSENRIGELRLGLAKKIHEAGQLYMVLREWNAAIITFEEIIESYYDTRILNDTYLDIASCYSKLSQREEMIQVLDKINVDALSTKNILTYNKLLKLSMEWPE